MTRDQIQSVLRQEYDQQRWLQILREIMPGTDVFAAPQTVPVNVPDSSPPVQLARIRLGDRKQLAVLEIKVSDRIDLLRNRVGLRNLVARFIDQAEYHGVLAVFLSPQKDYRFTFAAKISDLDQEGNLLSRETAPRRFTYLLGPNESCRTAAERFAHLSDKAHSATIQDVIEAFSVEKLNKEFFTDYCDALERVRNEIGERNRWEPKIADIEAQTLLNRLLFLYFVQRKGWLNRQRDYLHRNFQQFAGDADKKTTFLDGFLRPLFVKLSTEGKQANIEGHDLPFLNGGLFSDEYGDEHHDESVRRHFDLKVGNGVFAHVFENLLERYNFTIHEDSPNSYEVAIDPEMLGRIFEALTLQKEESESGGKSLRHDTGSHYTPRPIVHYLCRDSLAAWLESQPPFVGKKDSSSCVRKLLALDATEGVDDETRAALNEILTPEAAAVLLDGLFELRACDPGVGSGAFPMGLLHEMLNLARLCETRAAGKDPVLGDRAWLYNTKKRIIGRVVYGVDLQQQAVEICKLRLWLSLMVDYELSADPDNCEATSFRKALEKIEPLPNLDFKIRRANSLVDYIHGEPVELSQLSGETGAALPLNELASAKREFFNARTAAAKRKLRLSIYKALTDLAKIELTRARTETAKGFGFDLDERSAARVAEIDNGLKEIAFIAAQLRDARKLSPQAQEDALERIRARFDDPDKPTFVWKLDFAEVFHRDGKNQGDSLLPTDKPEKSTAASARSGFDLLIGNPPYIRIQTLKKTSPQLVEYYKTRYVSAGKGNYDLYVVFVERSLELLNTHGQLAFILPHRFFNAKYGEPLRGLLANGKHLRHVIHFGDQQIFPGATNYVCLLFLAKSGANELHFVRADNLKLWMATEHGVSANIPTKEIEKSEWNFVVGKGSDLFDRLQAIPTKLENVTYRIFQGLKTGADKIYIFEKATKTKNGHRIICRQTETEYVLEAELLHPLIKGGDSHAYRLTHPERIILFPYEKISDGQTKLIPLARLRKDFPLTWNYLKDHKDVLESRDGGEMVGEDWYGYSRAQALDLMVLPKLFTPDIAPVAGFSYDEAGEVFFTGGVAGGYGILATPPITPKFLLGILNSRASDYFHHRIATKMRGGWFSYESRFIRNLPIPDSDETQRQIVETLVGHLLWLRLQPSVTQPDRNHPQDPLIASYFEQTVNALVYELFFPQELHAAGLKFFELAATTPIAKPMNPPASAAGLDWYREQFKKLSAPGHPLRVALDKLQTLDLVRIIEGHA
jgi:hypothetical protein